MSQKTYQNIAELITDLLRADRNANGDAYINIDNFSGAFYKGVEDQTDDFWKELVKYLKIHAPTLQSNFNDLPPHAASVFSYINTKADLNGNTIWDVITAKMVDPNVGIDLSTNTGLPEGETDYFWNESLSKLAAIFMNSFGDTVGQIPLSDDASIAIADIMNADAGYSFVRDWVKPTTNIDNETYEEVRGADAIHSVLTNDSELQFTRQSGANNWIRLLMPKYLRKVEVEDLNRNFWVIGQVIAALSAQLFGNDSIKDMFEGILKELIGLWENVLYLWAAAAMTSQKDFITDIHIEFVPIPNSTILSYRKFDNFGGTIPSEANYMSEIQERMNYLIKTYTESNIIMIPEVRKNNYKHNYYSRVEYPCMIVYNRNTGKQIIGNFNVLDEDWRFDKNYLVVDLQTDFNRLSDWLYCDKIGAINEEENFYNYISQFSSITGVSPYYAAVRTVIPEFTATYDTENNQIKIDDFQFQFYDAAAQAYEGTKHLIISFTQTTPDDAEVNPGAANTWAFDADSTISKRLDLYHTEPQEVDVPSSQEPATIRRGFYLGELVSCQSILGLQSWDFNNNAFWGQPLMWPNAEEIVELMEAGE